MSSHLGTNSPCAMPQPSRSDKLPACPLWSSPQAGSLWLRCCRITHGQLAVQSRAGETHALKTTRMQILLVMQHLPLARTGSFENRIRRRQPAYPPLIVFAGDHLVIAFRISRLRLTEKGL